MSARELSKLELIQHVCDKRIRQIDAAQALKLSRRQIQRLVNLFREFGPQGLVSRKRSRPGNHQCCSNLKSQVLELIQVDGSPHDWFEGRADECTLLVFIDDATSAIMHMYFC